MKFITVEQMLPYKGSHKPSRKRLNTMKQDWKELPEDCNIEGITFAKGSLYKAFETTNFGWLVFHPESKGINGEIPGRRIFKY